MSHMPVIDGNGNPAYMFAVGDGSLQSPYSLSPMPRQQACIELGNVFQSSERHDLANNATLDHFLAVPLNSKVVLAGFDISTGSAPLEVDIFEGCIVSANGTQNTLFNLNRQSSDAPTCVLWESPTVTDSGIRLVSMLVTGDKSVGGSAHRGCGQILKAGEKYLFRIKNTSGGNARISIDIAVVEQ
jgi:hypothetical protein